jgi:hypothetical protein
MPDPASGHSRGHKYPFLSGEIFSCELGQIYEKFFELPDEIEQLTSPSVKKLESPEKNVDTDEEEQTVPLTDKEDEVVQDNAIKFEVKIEHKPAEVAAKEEVKEEVTESTEMTEGTLET